MLYNRCSQWVESSNVPLYPCGMRRQPLDVELAAATRAAAEAGLGPVTPEVLHLGNHTSVRLTPWPIVARIASGTSFDLSEAGIGRELTVGTFLARRNAPSVRPASRVSPGPNFQDDCAITFWEVVDGRGVVSEADERMAAASLKDLHSALADFETDLPSFVEKVASCGDILADAEQAPRLASSDRCFLQRLYQRLCNDLQRIGGTWQPIHGDAHSGNALITNAGAVWMDLESVCVGPVEWDIGFLPPETWSEFERADAALIRQLADVRSSCVATWCWAEFDRSSAAREAAVHHLDKLKRRFR